MQLNKASKPDGLPVEFFRAFWDIIKNDILALVRSRTFSISRLNRAAVTLIPKMLNPTSVSDYRAISVINTVAKIVTKVLANKLQPHLHKLIMVNKTAFVKGGSMMDSFLSAREFISFCSRKKLPAVLYKVDFKKAFDTVDWCFLVNLLIERGFPPKWTSMVLSTLKSSISTIRVNRSLTSYFTHRRVAAGRLIITNVLHSGFRFPQQISNQCQVSNAATSHPPTRNNTVCG